MVDPIVAWAFIIGLCVSAGYIGIKEAIIWWRLRHGWHYDYRGILLNTREIMERK